MTFRPKISLGQAGVAGVVYAQPRFKQWLPTTDPNCINMEHYGVDFCASMDVANAGGQDTDIDVARI